MISLVLVVYFVLGYSILSSFGKGLNLALKVGIAMLIGLGMNALFMFVFDLIGLPITLASLLVLAVVLSVLLLVLSKSVLADDFVSLKSFKIGFGQVHFTWVFFFFLVLYFVYGISAKGLFWPTAEYDSVAGYDYMAKMIAREGKMNVSLFRFSTDAYGMARFIYPPLVASSYALPYLCGMAMSKIMPIVFFVSLIISFYGCLLYYTTHTASIIATAFMALSPEMFSHAALSLTNLPNAAYASISIITFFLWVDKREKSMLLLSSNMMAFTAFSRSDSVVFIAAALIYLAYDFLKTKNIKPILIYGFVSSSLFLSWLIYLKFVIHSDSSDFFEKTLFWDPEKFDKIISYVADFMVWETQFYGVTFWLFYLCLVLNFKTIRTDLSAFLAVSITAWLLYTFLYYQMHYAATTLDMFMKASYKRGMFCFVPLAWFYIMANSKVVWLFKKFDDLMYR